MYKQAISFPSPQSYLLKAFIFLFCYACRKVLKNTSNKDVSKITKKKNPSSTQTPSARAGQLSGELKALPRCKWAQRQAKRLHGNTAIAPATGSFNTNLEIKENWLTWSQKEKLKGIIRNRIAHFVFHNHHDPPFPNKSERQQVLCTFSF